MALFMNSPDKIVCDAFSDTTIKNNTIGGAYNSFTNQLNTPILGLKGVQLLRMNFVNSLLQLNDNAQLMFFYYRSADINIIDPTKLRCVRLYPSNYVPAPLFTSYVKNKYFNNVPELVQALNAAASTGGDDLSNNPIWQVNDVAFSYSLTERKITFTGADINVQYAPAAADDPNVLAYLATNAITMNAYNGIIVQNYALKQSMNARLGFAQSYYNRGIWWSGSSKQGVATSTGVAQIGGVGIIADAFPILIAAQTINVYLNIIVGSGLDSKTNKNLIASIPVEQASQFIGSYTLTSVEQPASTVANEAYTFTFTFTDEFGNPYYMNANNNTTLELNLFYNKYTA